MAHSRQRHHVMDFLHYSLQADPVHRVTAAQIHHLEAAARLHIARGQVVIQGQAGKGLVMAGFGGAEAGKIAVANHAAQVTGSEGDRFELARIEIHAATFVGAGIAEPQLSAMPARRLGHRLGHRQPNGHHRIGRHIDALDITSACQGWASTCPTERRLRRRKVFAQE
jgi:hypothetical protein